MTRCSRVPATVVCLARHEILGATAGSVTDAHPRWAELRDHVRRIIQTIIIESHERLVFVVVLGGGDPVLPFRVALVVLDVASPLVGDIGLELGGFACAWSIVNNSSAQRKLVGILCLTHGRDEMRKWIVVHVGKMACLSGFVLGHLNTGREGEGPVGGA